MVPNGASGQGQAAVPTRFYGGWRIGTSRCPYAFLLSPRQKIGSRENSRRESRVGRGFTPLLRAMPLPSTQVHTGKRR